MKRPDFSPQGYDVLDVRAGVTSLLEAMSEKFKVSGRKAKQILLNEIAAVARQMKGEQ